jgi:hypothetical protein
MSDPMGDATKVYAMPIALPGPTVSGCARYPKAGGYYRLHDADAFRFPCRCEAECATACAGGCGCFACRVAAADRRSAEALKLLREKQDSAN